MKVFDQTEAEIYDQKMPFRVPGYEMLPDLALACISLDPESPSRILVVGAGTGYELTRMARLRPKWTFEAVEPAENMRIKAEENLAKIGALSRVRFHTCRLEEIDEALTCDAATSILVSHFIPDDGGREHYIKEIGRHIKLDGKLFLVDLANFSTDENLLINAWYNWMSLRGVTQETIRAASDGLTSSFFPISNTRLKELAAKAGFPEAIKVYQCLGFCGHLLVK